MSREWAVQRRGERNAPLVEADTVDVGEKGHAVRRAEAALGYLLVVVGIGIV